MGLGKLSHHWALKQIGFGLYVQKKSIHINKSCLTRNMWRKASLTVNLRSFRI
jgi:hypothetical protein